ncbi:hypothetical protein N7E02_06600 (plasmid) [Aliirhizobium terrae]|uniref:hypothetical protein n=1 Tax=Terrirhizobium terrae TaxID=2926709 RepID=UPI002578C694|nr:hypothetical protein [Rhizobium sp. CC-CFT758]WJH38314.1 hypothetical protein N7E02_06600 [Rhizobium sp. CC-CFT758]
MSDSSTITVHAIFETREAAHLAVEYLVQKHGIPRPDIFVQAANDENSAGSAPSGGDVSSSGKVRTDAPLTGDIEVSVDIAADRLAAVQRGLGDLGAMRVSGR